MTPPPTREASPCLKVAPHSHPGQVIQRHPRGNPALRREQVIHHLERVTIPVGVRGDPSTQVALVWDSV